MERWIHHVNTEEHRERFQQAIIDTTNQNRAYGHLLLPSAHPTFTDRNYLNDIRRLATPSAALVSAFLHKDSTGNTIKQTMLQEWSLLSPNTTPVLFATSASQCIALLPGIYIDACFIFCHACMHACMHSHVRHVLL
jgi:hypothetical protein